MEQRETAGTPGVPRWYSTLTFAVWLGTLAVSYRHIVGAFSSHGETGWSAYVSAGTVDLVLALAVGRAVSQRSQGRPAPGSWAAVVLAGGVSLAANVSQAWDGGVGAWLVASWPPVGAFIAWLLFDAALRDASRGATAPLAASPAPGVPEATPDPLDVPTGPWTDETSAGDPWDNVLPLSPHDDGPWDTRETAGTPSVSQGVSRGDDGTADGTAGVPRGDGGWPSPSQGGRDVGRQWFTQAVREAGAVPSVSQLAEASGWARSTAARVLAELKREGAA